MPELPDLEIVAQFLNRQLAGATIEAAQVPKPIVVRDLTGGGFVARLAGQRVEAVSRRGKFLLFKVDSGDWLVVNAMRSGRLRYLVPGQATVGKPFLVLRFADGAGLQYSDPDTMGKVYLTKELDRVPTFAALGPEALDPELTASAFAEYMS